MQGVSVAGARAAPRARSTAAPRWATRSSAPARGPIAWRSPPAPTPTRGSCPSAAPICAWLPERRDLVRSLIYPVPDPSLPFLGVHLTKHIDGDVLIGPTALIVGARDAYSLATVRRRDLLDTLAWPGTWRMLARWWSTGATELRHAALALCVRQGGRPLRARAARSRCGSPRSRVWAQALGRNGPASSTTSFSPRTDRALHVRNAPSPAATSSLAIARHVVRRPHGRAGWRGHLFGDAPGRPAPVPRSEQDAVPRFSATTVYA